MIKELPFLNGYPENPRLRLSQWRSEVFCIWVCDLGTLYTLKRSRKKRESSTRMRKNVTKAHLTQICPDPINQESGFPRSGVRCNVGISRNCVALYLSESGWFRSVPYRASIPSVFSFDFNKQPAPPTEVLIKIQKAMVHAEATKRAFCFP